MSQVARKEAEMTWGKTLLISGFLLCVLSLANGCSGGDGKRVVAFVQSTKNSGVNQAIMERYVWPIFRNLEKSGEPFQLDVYPLTGHTVGSTAFFSATVKQGPTQGQERIAAEHRFLELRRVLDKTYGPEESELLDVLGSLHILDDVLGRMREDKRPLYVIYVSDMVQSNGEAGYDFTGYYGSRGLADCRKNLNEEVGATLRNKDKFSLSQILVLKLDRQSLFRELGTEAIPPPENLSDIEQFWATDVFGSLLRVGAYHVDSSRDPRRAVQEFLQ